MKIDPAIQAILDSYDTVGGIHPLGGGTTLPSKKEVTRFIDTLYIILFPGYFEPLTPKGLSVSDLCDKISSVEHTLTTLSCDTTATAFIAFIPSLRQRLKEDLVALYDGDPAARSEHEIILAYPGFFAITIYRMACFFYQKKASLLARLMSSIAYAQTGIDIHPGATIGRHFCIDHGSGVVIGETAVLGNHVKLYQGVTLGALSVSKKDIQGKRHPSIEDHVTIYSGTTILGGSTTIGHHCVIGGNVWITSSIPPYSKVYLSKDQTQVLKTEGPTP